MPNEDILALLRRLPADQVGPPTPELVFVRRRRPTVPPPPPAQLEPSTPLPAMLQAEVESAMGQGMAGVRLHTGEAAQAMASRFGAAAFAHGRDVFFAQGRFRPEDAEARALLAHEAMHVRQLMAGVPETAEDGEAEAEAAERQVLAQERPGQGAVLTVNKLVRNYVAQGAELRPADVARLDGVSAQALAVCEQLLAGRAPAADIDLSALRVQVTLDLDRASDEELAAAWGQAMAEAIERQLSAAGNSQR